MTRPSHCAQTESAPTPSYVMLTAAPMRPTVQLEGIPMELPGANGRTASTAMAVKASAAPSRTRCFMSPMIRLTVNVSQPHRELVR